ncbi:MAG: DNA polymerase III subunit delta [Anaerolineae bacterium]|jgi:DNA polymerase-3 subunit delta
MAARPTPRYYVLHGKDELTRSEALGGLKARLGSPELAVLNTTVFDGADVTLVELKNACDTIPFLTQRRMVIVRGLLSRLVSPAAKKGKKDVGWQKSYREALAAYLPQLPETTRLVFVEPDQLPKNHPILRQAEQDEFGYVRAFAPPKDLVKWVRRRASDKGGQFSPQAAASLVGAVGDNQRLLDQEIEKLLAYTNQERPVSSADVSSLVPYAQEAVIFDAVDALGQRDGAKAVRLLHNLLDHGNDPLYLFAMIVRQFRLLIQIKELSDEGLSPPDIAKKIKLHPFPTRKLYTQARNFRLEQLERVHCHLLELDVQIKTGQINNVVALDLFVAGLAPPQ